MIFIYLLCFSTTPGTAKGGKEKKRRLNHITLSKKKKKSPLKPKLLKHVSQSFMQRQRAVKLGLAVLGKEISFKTEKALKASQIMRIWVNLWNKPEEKTDVSYFSLIFFVHLNPLISSVNSTWTEYDLYVITLLDISIGAGM